MSNPLHFAHELTIDGTAYEVIRVETHEPIDGIPHCRCEITDGQGGPEPAALVGKELVLTISLRDGSAERKFTGLVTEAERTTLTGDQVIGTRLVAEPRLFKLARRHASRVFQDMTVDEIVTKVLDDGGVADHAWQLEGSYPKRVYTTQFRETDFDFIRRLLFEEGIAFAVDSSSGVDTVVFFDADLGPIDGDKEMPVRYGDGLVGTFDAVTSIRHERETKSGKVHLRDYDFERPQLGLDAKSEADDDFEKGLEVYVYPGRYTEPSVGDRYAKNLLESIRSRRETIRGTTSTLRLHAGRLFDLKDHPYEPLNQEYRVLEVVTVHEVRKPRDRGQEGESRTEFVATPTKDTTYRPARIPPALAEPGAQLGVITGPAGTEIHPDEHGRVKIHFWWDREGKTDDSSSLWIRTSQLALGGSMLTPRVGWESYLNFIDGDVDQPFVFGRMYNAEKPPPYALPGDKTRMSIQTATTPGGGSSNEFRMEDKKGSEEMFMNASKDASVSAGNNATEDVGNNETRAIGSNHSLSVTDSMSSKVGAAQSLDVSGDQKVNVGTFMVDDVGSHSHTISGARDIKAGGDHKRTVTGASTLTINGMQIDLVAGSVDEETMSTMDDTVGAVLVEMTASDRTVTVKGARTESAGAAKVVLSGGGRAVTVGGSLSQKVAGAILTKVKGDRADSSEGSFLEVAGGAQLIKATNVVFKADDLLSVVMGASTITLTPASVSIAGTNITLKGDVSQTSALIADNI
jgi:type VI secretion system secreted protein VgrG